MSHVHLSPPTAFSVIGGAAQVPGGTLGWHLCSPCPWPGLAF